MLVKQCYITFSLSITFYSLCNLWHYVNHLVTYLLSNILLFSKCLVECGPLDFCMSHAACGKKSLPTPDLEDYNDDCNLIR